MVSYSITLQQILTAANKSLQQISETEMQYKPTPQKWSKKQILGHLIDSAYNNHRRFAQASEQDNLIFDGYDQVKWVEKNNYQNRETSEIINTWLAVNQHLSHLIQHIPKDMLYKVHKRHNFDKICMNRIPKGQETTLDYLIWDYLFHLEHHLGQIISGYEKLSGEYRKR